MLSDEWLPRYRLLENFTAKWKGNGNGNAYDRGDYNSSFALRAVELKTYRCCGCSLETPLQGNSNKHPQHRVYRNMAQISLTGPEEEIRCVFDIS